MLGWHVFWPFHWLSPAAWGIVVDVLKFVLVGAVIAAMVWALQHSSRWYARQILERRHENGEIDQKEYDQKLKDLG